MTNEDPSNEERDSEATGGRPAPAFVSTRETILKAWREGCPTCGMKSSLRRGRQARGVMVVDVLECRNCASKWTGEEIPAVEMLGLDGELLIEEM
jgi:hypothetical protein